MTSRQRIQKVLRGEKPDRVPFNFWMDRWRMAELDRDLGNGKDFRLEYYDADVVEVIPNVPWFSDFISLTRADRQTVWHVTSAVDSILPLLEHDLPPIDESITSYIIEARARYPDKAIFTLMLTPLDAIMGKRLMQDFFVDIYDYPSEVEELCNKIGDHQTKIIEHIIDRCDIDAIYMAGDICANSGALMSSELLRKLWLTPMKKVTATAHNRDTPVLYHTDGRVIEILDLLAESGIDGLNPLQANLQEDDEFEPWKDRFILYGTMDNNSIIPNGPEQVIRKHIRDKFDHFKDGRGLIFSSHDIQGDTPQGHINAMVDEIKSCRY